MPQDWLISCLHCYNVSVILHEVFLLLNRTLKFSFILVLSLALQMIDALIKSRLHVMVLFVLME